MQERWLPIGQILMVIKKQGQVDIVREHFCELCCSTILDVLKVA
jgi:hypothetical protein